MEACSLMTKIYDSGLSYWVDDYDKQKKLSKNQIIIRVHISYKIETNQDFTTYILFISKGCESVSSESWRSKKKLLAQATHNQDFFSKM